ncbi:LolA-like protein [Anaerocolumna xylanovorans]|uniref:Outer membrane lipoprotein-sorting protein n=1 Tax=Anaerocolumna xylanovorans DSM 12503 TaxID=1121345 RepID=A0A1M7YFM9_9FIRM|nr:hypothetical protein [Anaerocolumna xylanovorans]SHO51457.1 Outer membrane lipoprotein-sorting protein [Anaerocolumna xylanovorans DSM 12503]
MRKEKIISEYIDRLNQEQVPGKEAWAEEEIKELTDTIRALKSLEEPVYPEEGFEKQLSDTMWRAYKETGEKERKEPAKRGSKLPKRVFWGAAAAAAVFLGVLYLKGPIFSGTDPVYAMEQAYEKANAYHGILTVTSINGEGQRNVQAVREVWADKEGRYYVKELQGIQKGLITANNNKEKWQMKKEDNYISLYAAFPDNYSFTFEIGKEIKEIEEAKAVKEADEDTIGGVQAVLYKVTPKGGDTYSLWLDKNTGMPLKKQSAMVNGIAYELSYKDIAYTSSIPKEYLSYGDLTGYVVNREDNWQLCATMEEAEGISGFTPELPDISETSYSMMEISANAADKALKVYYGLDGQENKIAVIEKAAAAKEESSKAVTGSIGSIKAEIITDAEGTDIEAGSKAVSIAAESFGQQTGITSIRWQQDGIAYQIIGNGSMDEINVFVKALTGNKAVLPEVKEDTPQVKADYDIKTEEETQKGVDAGHQPWKLDPAFVAQVFTSLLLYPEGITGDYPIPYEDFKVTKNTGSSVVIEVDNKKSPVSKIYLKQLVRQDSTGIWTVVGYDKNNNYRKN